MRLFFRCFSLLCIIKSIVETQCATTSVVLCLFQNIPEWYKVMHDVQSSFWPKSKPLHSPKVLPSKLLNSPRLKSSEKILSRFSATQHCPGPFPQSYKYFKESLVKNEKWAWWKWLQNLDWKLAKNGHSAIFTVWCQDFDSSYMIGQNRVKKGATCQKP